MQVVIEEYCESSHTGILYYVMPPACASGAIRTYNPDTHNIGLRERVKVFYTGRTQSVLWENEKSVTQWESTHIMGCDFL